MSDSPIINESTVVRIVGETTLVSVVQQTVEVNLVGPGAGIALAAAARAEQAATDGAVDLQAIADQAAASAAAFQLGIVNAAAVNSGYTTLTETTRNLFSYTRTTAGTARVLFPIPNRAAGSKITILYAKRSATGSIPAVRLRSSTGFDMAATSLVAHTDEDLQFLTLTVEATYTAQFIGFSTSNIAAGEIFFIAFDGEGQFLTSSNGRVPVGVERAFWRLYKEQVARKQVATDLAALTTTVTANAAALNLGITSSDATNSGYDTLTAPSRNLFTYSKTTAATARALFSIPNVTDGQKVTVLYKVRNQAGGVPTVRLRSGTTYLTATALVVDGEWHTATLTGEPTFTATQLAFGTSSIASGEIFFIAFSGDGTFLTGTNGRLPSGVERMAWEIYALATNFTALDARVDTLENAPVDASVLSEIADLQTGAVPQRLKLLDRDILPPPSEHIDAVASYLAEDRDRALITSDGRRWVGFDGVTLAEVPSKFRDIARAAGGVTRLYVGPTGSPASIVLGAIYANGTAAQIQLGEDNDGLVLLQGGHVGAADNGVLSATTRTRIVTPTSIPEGPMTATVTGSGVTADWVPEHSASGAARSLVADIRIDGQSIGSSIAAIDAIQEISSFEMWQTFEGFSSNDVAGNFPLGNWSLYTRFDRDFLVVDTEVEVPAPLTGVWYPGLLMIGDTRYLNTFKGFETGTTFAVGSAVVETDTAIHPPERVAMLYHAANDHLVAVANLSLDETMPAVPVSGDQFLRERPTPNFHLKLYSRRFNGSIPAATYRTRGRMVLASGFDPASL